MQKLFYSLSSVNKMVKMLFEFENRNWKQSSSDRSKFLAPNKFETMENTTFHFSQKKKIVCLMKT